MPATRSQQVRTFIGRTGEGECATCSRYLLCTAMNPTLRSSFCKCLIRHAEFQRELVASMERAEVENAESLPRSGGGETVGLAAVDAGTTFGLGVGAILAAWRDMRRQRVASATRAAGDASRTSKNASSAAASSATSRRAPSASMNVAERVTAREVIKRAKPQAVPKSMRDTCDIREGFERSVHDDHKSNTCLTT
eukprot:3973010-Pleurochrysis_carterae.AAC.2